MPQGIQLIKELLNYVEDYENKFQNNDLTQFAIYLKDSVLQNEKFQSSKELDDFKDYRKYPEVEFSTLLVNLYRFAKHYIKKGFSDTSLRTIEEFGFLASLFKEGSMHKNELINSHLLETSGGSEILKRLIKKQFIKQFPDEKDKRAKRVSLTEKGRVEIIKAFRQMHTVSKIVSGNLSQVELTDALFALNKLNYFHRQIHQCDRNSPLEEIEEKYIS